MGKYYELLSRNQTGHLGYDTSQVRGENSEYLSPINRPANSQRSIQNVLFTRPNRQGRSSFYAVKYATSLAMDSKLKVLLVDTKIAEPNFHEVFDIAPNRAGLFELISSDRDFDEIVTAAEQNNLSILGAGKCLGHSPGLFNSKYFDNFLSVAKNKFDHIVFDAPPALSSSATRILGSKTDGTILVLESGKTRSHVALRAKKELEYSGAVIIGVILSKRKRYIPNWIYKRL